MTNINSADDVETNRQSDSAQDGGVGEKTSGDGVTPSVTRRDLLKHSGTAALATVGLGTNTASAESYTTVTASSGELLRYSIGSGETLENYLFDVTADDAGVRIYAEGDGWTIRDIGVKGTIDHPDADHILLPECPNSGDTGLIENCYFGDGAVDGGAAACYVHYNHAGTITIRNVYLRGLEEGIYASDPGNNGLGGNGGEVRIEGCYARNNNVQQYRIGSDNSYVKNSVAHVDNVPVAADNGGYNARGVWAKEGGDSMTIENCDILLEHDYASYCVVEADDTECATVDVVDSELDYCCGASGRYYSECGTINTSNVGQNPDVSVPNCVPTSPKDAADGSDCDGGSTTEVAEDFSHNDIPGTYDLDTGAFATTSTRSTSDSYSLRADDSSDSNEMILRDDMVTSSGNTYELDVYFPSNTDMGFMFGAQSATGYSDYTGYTGFFESDAGEIRIDLLENGSISSQSATATTWPLGEWLTVELDYRDSDSSTITMTVFDAAGQQVASTSLSDTTYDSGSIGWYNWYADADWHADSWFDASGGSSATVVDGFEDGDISEYAFDRGSSGASVVSSPTHSGSYALEYAGANVEAISTSGLDVYPSAGDTVSFWVRGSGGAAKTNLSYGVQDHANRYFVRVNVASDNFALYRYENDSGYELAGDWSAPTLSQDTWYEVEVQWATDGTQTVTLYDSGGSQLTQISGTDSTWTSGGVGYDAYLGSGESAYFDDVTIE